MLPSYIAIFGRAARTAALALATALPLTAQTAPPTEVGRPTARDVAAQPSSLPYDVERGTTQRGPLLDAPISRTGYHLGPGDQIVVAIFGDINQVYTLQVQPEGSVVVPGIGIANVLGLNLEEAEQRIDSMVLRYYRNVTTGVSLAAVRAFKVFVVGDVPVPGVRTATAATRVSEILDDVMAQEGERTARRNVVLRRSSSDTIIVDIARFFQSGDLSANPLLREGDIIVVPTLDRTVHVAGRVRFPAVYQYRPGESLADLLSVANGGAEFPADAADTIRIARLDQGQRRQFIDISRADAISELGRSFRLEPFDAVFVAEKADFGRQPSATIRGQVRHPGTYPIRPDTTTIRDLVEMAGGFTPHASLVQATLRRKPGSWESSLKQLDTIPIALLSEAERDFLRVRLQSDATVASVGFQDLFAQGREVGGIALRADDEITVPEHRNEVLVLGAVAQPGIVNYVEGSRPETFIEMAGGATRRADLRNVSVIKGRTGTRAEMRDVHALDAGDAVIVPYRRDVNWSQRIQLATGIAAALTGLALTAITLF
jgi:polysaccharide biosynthesis/export protein